MKILLSGGRQSREAGALERDHRFLYDKAVLALFDTETRALEPWLSLHASDGQSQRFGAPSTDGRDVIACTEREVLRIGPGRTILDRWSHPAMSDLHHAAVVDGVMYAASTGIGGVLVSRGEQAAFFATETRAQLPVRDVRGERLRSQSHPNYLWSWRGEIFATLGRSGGILQLGALGSQVQIAEVTVHDGCPAEEGVWPTRVDGALLLVDPSRGCVLRSVSLGRSEGGEEPLGWCRGLLVSGDIAWVGFTRIRTTTLRGSLAWVRGRLRGRPIATRRPTRLAAFELSTGRCLDEIPLDEVEIDVLMGMTPLPEADRPAARLPRSLPPSP